MKRHSFDPVSFVFGLLFAFLAVFVLSGNTLADLYPLWVWTLPAMAVGLLVVLYGVRRLVASPVDRDAWGERSDESPVPDAPLPAPAPDPKLTKPDRGPHADNLTRRV